MEANDRSDHHGRCVGQTDGPAQLNVIFVIMGPHMVSNKLLPHEVREINVACRHYSYLSESDGLASAALAVWMVTVPRAMNKARRDENRNIPIEMPVR